MRYLYTLLLSLLAFSSDAQVPQKIVVEHTTNTVCSVCASRNPAFYSNLSNHPEILHLAIHPSSPYPSCILNQHNKPENDGRTNYYGIYGSTPRLVIQGMVIPANENYSSSMIFSQFQGQTSPVSIRIEQKKHGNDSISVKAVLKIEAANTLGNLRLFVALAEDTIFYNAPNGEQEHYDVFRKALTDVTGDQVILPSSVGDSLVFNFSAPAHQDWDFSRIYTMVILQDESTKEVIQAEAASPKDGNIPTGIKQVNQMLASIFPNPVTDILIVDLESPIATTLQIFDVAGKLQLEQNIEDRSEINLSDLTAGVYLLKLKNKEGIFSKTLIRK